MAVKALSPKHWTARDVPPKSRLLKKKLLVMKKRQLKCLIKQYDWFYLGYKSESSQETVISDGKAHLSTRSKKRINFRFINKHNLIENTTIL